MIVTVSSSVILVLFLGALAALSNLAGGALPLLRRRRTDRLMLYGLAFSGGFLLSVALLHIIPESLRGSPHSPLLILTGYFLVYVAEHLFAGHAHGPPHQPHGAHPLVGAYGCRSGVPRIRIGAAWSAVAGLTVHSFFDGAAIAATLGARKEIGMLIALAVILHKIPEGFSVSAIAMSSSRSRRAAFTAAGALATASIAGTLVTIFAAGAVEGLATFVLAVAAGMFIHIAATDLLPTTAQVRGVRVMAAAGTGALTVILLSALLGFAP